MFKKKKKRKKAEEMEAKEYLSQVRACATEKAFELEKTRDKGAYIR